MTGILASLQSKSMLRVYNQTQGVDALKNLKVKRSRIRFTSEPMRHQQEDGTTIVDTRIIRPAKIDLEIICPDVSTLDQINAVLADRTSLFQISSRGVILANMQSDADVIRFSGEMLSATPVRMSFQQVLIQNASPIVFANQADATLIDRGIAIINSAPETLSSIVTKVSKIFGRA